MKTYLLLVVSTLFLWSCSKGADLTEGLGLVSLLGYRQNVTINGSFFGNFNADVKAIPLGADGKCNRSTEGLGFTSTDNSGAFSINYPRISQNGGYVCLISYPKADGTSRFFAVDQQKEFPWTGSSAFNVLVLPEPSTTSRSKFNVVSTMFNRMATQRLERLAAGNTDPAKTASYLKTANRQIVSQFGLSKGITRGVLRASSIEMATPDLNDIAIDFNNKEDPTTLKFTVMIGGIQSLGDPTKPESYDQVVNVISKYLASGTGSSVDESGEPLILPGQTQPLSLGGGNSLASQISNKVAAFVQTQAAALGLPPSAVSAVTQQVQAQVAAVDKPSFGVIAPPVVVEVVPRLTYSVQANPFYAGQTISIKPDYLNSNAERYSLVSATPSLPSYLRLNSFTGEISGVVPTNLSSITNLSLVVSGTAPGGRTINRTIDLQLIPAILVYADNSPIGSAGQKFSLNPLSETTASKFTLSSEPSLPEYISFNTNTGELSGTVPGNLSAVTAYTLKIDGSIPTGVIDSKTLTLVLSPPAKVSYMSNSPSYNAGNIFSIEPDTSNTTANNFSLSNNPPFMNINSKTGVITGTVPSTLMGEETHSVTVTGKVPDGKEKSQTLFFTFKGSSFSFPQEEYSYVIDQTITIVPTVFQMSDFRFSKVQCAGEQCGLVGSESTANFFGIDPTTGEITGKVPSNLLGSLKLDITVTGTANSGEISKNISMVLSGKAGIVYSNQVDASPISVVYLGAEYVSLIPHITGQFTNLEFKNLPPGMAPNYNTGEISGSSPEIINIYDTKIIINSVNGPNEYNIQFKPIAPSGFTYPNPVTSLKMGQTVNILPTYTGGLKSCILKACNGENFSTSLPKGLFLEPNTCAIYGLSEEVAPSQSYCVEAKNLSGSDFASIQLSVTAPINPPSISNSLSRVFLNPQSVSISNTLAGSSTYYSIDGSNPTGSSQLYTSPISVWSLAGKVLKAITKKAFYEDSPITVMSGVVGVPPLQTGSTETSVTTGDDAFYKSGLPRTFTQNPDNTVTYTITGLVWQTATIGSKNWTAARTTCSETYGAGWRLPSIEELATLVNLGTASPTIDNKNILPTNSSPYWSDTESREDSEYAFALGFGVGRIFADSKTTSNFVRCVRGNHVFRKTNAYRQSELSPSVVYDSATGLLWERDGSKTMTYSNAINYCNSLSLDGKKWRLPNRNELLSLVDYSSSSFPLIDQSVFNNTHPRYWTSTKSMDFWNPGRWVVNFSMYQNGVSDVDGGYPLGESTVLGVRCVNGFHTNPEISYPQKIQLTSTTTTFSPEKPLVFEGVNLSFSAQNLPSGLSLNPGNGQISGYVFDGIYNVTLNVVSGTNTYSFPVEISVSQQNLGFLNYTVYQTPSGTSTYANSASDFDNFFQSTVYSPIVDSGYLDASKILYFTSYTALTPSNVKFPYSNSGEYYSVKAEGYFRPTRAGVYTFSCTGDDGVDVLINGQLICSHYGPHGFANLGAFTGTYTVHPENVNKPVSFKARMQEIGGGDGLDVRWNRPGDSGWYIYREEMSRY